MIDQSSTTETPGDEPYKHHSYVPDGVACQMESLTYQDRHGNTLLCDVDLRFPVGRVVGVCSLASQESMALVSLAAGKISRFAGQLTFPLAAQRKSALKPFRGRPLVRSHVVVEDHAFLPDLSVQDNLLAGTQTFLRRFLGKKSGYRTAQDLLNQFGLPADPQARCDVFDKAQRTAMSICRALLNPADVYVFANVKAALSDRARIAFRSQIGRLADEGALVLIVEDSVDELTGYCDDQILLCRGRVAQHGPASLYPIEIQRCLVAQTIPRLRQASAIAFRTSLGDMTRIRSMLTKTLELSETLAPSQRYCIGYVDVGIEHEIVASLGVSTQIQNKLLNVMSDGPHRSSARSRLRIDGNRISVFSAAHHGNGCCFVAYLCSDQEQESEIPETNGVNKFDETRPNKRKFSPPRADPTSASSVTAAQASPSEGELFYAKQIPSVAKEAVLALASKVGEIRAQQTQRHSRRLESLGELAGGISHDINNWLTAIMNRAEVLKAENRQSELFEGIDSIIGATQSAGAITGKLLAFARRGMAEFSAISIHDVIDDSILILGRSIDKRVIIRRNLNAGSPVINGDASELQNVFVNLAINSWKAMQETGGAIRISTSNQTFTESTNIGSASLPAGEYVKIIVADTGVGMSPESVDKAFEPFFTLRTNGSGSGLGLATAQGAVLEHRGAITLTSQKGVGTEVTIWLPNAMPGTKLPSETNRLDGGDGTILICDDEPMVLRSMEKQLRLLGYRVIAARNATECIETYLQRHHEIDLVLLDFIMPDMDGHSCFLRLKKIDPTIIAMLVTGYRQDSKVSDLFASGIRGIVHKPYRLKTLSKQIRALI